MSLFKGFENIFRLQDRMTRRLVNALENDIRRAFPATSRPNNMIEQPRNDNNKELAQASRSENDFSPFLEDADLDFIRPPSAAFNVDMVETDNGFKITADLPGFKKEDIKVRVEEGALVISGERKNETKTEGKRSFRSERTYGQFTRVLPLPKTADMESIKAKYENGVLNLDLGKRDVGASEKQIAIE
eukprot:GILJ01003344.1.p3 GENE.GILJ01003344.1~~GILJ01003344.1.p3  ORF type:complete len:188 (-),score=30.55 GILJ01003344.1:1129-1692(-)